MRCGEVGDVGPGSPTCMIALQTCRAAQSRAEPQRLAVETPNRAKLMPVGANNYVLSSPLPSNLQWLAFRVRFSAPGIRLRTNSANVFAYIYSDRLDASAIQPIDMAAFLRLALCISYTRTQCRTRARTTPPGRSSSPCREKAPAPGELYSPRTNKAAIVQSPCPPLHLARSLFILLKQVSAERRQLFLLSLSRVTYLFPSRFRTTAHRELPFDSQAKPVLPLAAALKSRSVKENSCAFVRVGCDLCGGVRKAVM